jgi:pSer/pThr/pTyr-binding forkhead associated (FHA) protein
MAKVVIIFGPGKGLSYKIAEQGAILGRQSTNNIPLPDTQASRQHSRIFGANDSYYIEDMGSRNGTWVNGKRIEREALCNDDRIKIGDTTLLFVLQEQTPEMSPLIELELPSSVNTPASVSAELSQQKTQRIASPVAASKDLPPPATPSGQRLGKIVKPSRARKKESPAILVSELSWPGKLVLWFSLLLLLLVLVWISRWLTLSLLT